MRVGVGEAVDEAAAEAHFREGLAVARDDERERHQEFIFYVFSCFCRGSFFFSKRRGWLLRKLVL